MCPSGPAQELLRTDVHARHAARVSASPVILVPNPWRSRRGVDSEQSGCTVRGAKRAQRRALSVSSRVKSVSQRRALRRRVRADLHIRVPDLVQAEGVDHRVQRTGARSLNPAATPRTHTIAAVRRRSDILADLPLRAVVVRRRSQFRLRDAECRRSRRAYLERRARRCEGERPSSP